MISRFYGSFDSVELRETNRAEELQKFEAQKRSLIAQGKLYEDAEFPAEGKRQIIRDPG